MPEIIRIPVPPDFSFAECLWFLDRDLDDCMHRIFPGSVRKLVINNGAKVLIEVFEKNAYLNIKALAGQITDKNEMMAFLDEWIDYQRDIKPFYRLLKKDKDLSHLEKKFRGLRMIGIPDFFEVLCWCVIGQQINLPFAYKIKRRIVEAYGSYLDHEGQRYYIFPPPEVIGSLSIGELKSFQLTTRKAEYLLGIARLMVAGTLSKEKLKKVGDETKIKEDLIKIRGIGEWTANYALMKGLRGMNGVPYGDSGLNQALEVFKGIPKKNNRKQVDQVFKAFEGWKTYLVFYLWRSRRN